MHPLTACNCFAKVSPLTLNSSRLSKHVCMRKLQLGSFGKGPPEELVQIRTCRFCWQPRQHQVIGSSHTISNIPNLLAEVILQKLCRYCLNICIQIHMYAAAGMYMYTRWCTPGGVHQVVYTRWSSTPCIYGHNGTSRGASQLCVNTVAEYRWCKHLTYSQDA